jgi:hypothetical protein
MFTLYFIFQVCIEGSQLCLVNVTAHDLSYIIPSRDSLFSNAAVDRLQQLVYEKAMRLRIMMKMHGLSDAVYWLVTFCWYLVLSVVYFMLLIGFGSAIGLKFFTLNSYGTPPLSPSSPHPFDS